MERPKRLYEESFEIDGARKLLEKLQHDFLFSMTPAIRMKCRGPLGQERFDDFPVPPKYRRLFGEGMIRFLLSSKDNVRLYLYGDCPLRFRPVIDTKGKLARIDIYLGVKDP